MDDTEKLNTVSSLLAGMYVEFKYKSYSADPPSELMLEESKRLESTDVLTLISYLDSLYDIILELSTEKQRMIFEEEVEEAVKRKCERGEYDMSKDER